MLWMRIDVWCGVCLTPGRNLSHLTRSFGSDPPVCETGQLIQVPGEQ